MKNNTTAKFGEIHEGSAFATDAETLKKGGYIKTPTKADYDRASKQKEAAESTVGTEEENTKKNYSKMLKADLQKEATLREIEYLPTATVEDLIKLLEENDEVSKS